MPYTDSSVGPWWLWHSYLVVIWWMWGSVPSKRKCLVVKSLLRFRLRGWCGVQEKYMVLLEFWLLALGPYTFRLYVRYFESDKYFDRVLSGFVSWLDRKIMKMCMVFVCCIKVACSPFLLSWIWNKGQKMKKITPCAEGSFSTERGLFNAWILPSNSYSFFSLRHRQKHDHRQTIDKWETVFLRDEKDER